MHIKEIEVNIAFMERKNAYKRNRSYFGFYWKWIYALLHWDTS